LLGHQDEKGGVMCMCIGVYASIKREKTLSTTG
jgi:hypothetical protein